MERLKFQQGNSKLNKNIYTFTLPAGHTCPFALKCFSKFDPSQNKIIDGPNIDFRCFAVTYEARFKNARNNVWHNLNLLKSCNNNITKLYNLIFNSIPLESKIIRIHVGGDFFHINYFKAWLNVISKFPNITFYAYTKAIPFIVKYKNNIPSNFKITASFGGTHDDLIIKHNLISAQVVFSPNNTTLPIDHNDSLAIANNQPFALLLHGMQPKQSPASKAWNTLKKLNLGGYNRNKTK